MTGHPLPARSAYLRPRTLQEWTLDDCRNWAEHTREAGFDAVVTKFSTLTDAQAAVLRSAGLTLVGSFSCYSMAGAGTGDVGHAPVGESGHVLGPVEWYSGLVPGDPALEEARAMEFGQLLERGLGPLVVLDFLRWPGHWETEGRNGGAPPASSFDSATLTRFVSWADERGVDARGVDPHAPGLSAALLLGDLKEHWVGFRSELVTGFARRLAGLAHQRSVAVGAFLVPVPDRRRRELYGQDVGALAEDLDVFVPMTYHAIAGRPARWSRDFSLETQRLVDKPVIAMVQLTSSEEYSGGWDWGAPVERSDVQETVLELADDVSRGALAGYCVFPGEALPAAIDTRSTPHPHHFEGTSHGDQ